MVMGRRIDYLSPTIYLTDILVVFTLLFWIREKPVIRISKYFVLIPLYIAINIWFAKSQPIAFIAWIKVVEYALLGVYIVQTKPKREIIIIGFAIGVLYSSIIAIAQFYFQHSLGGIFWWLGERTFFISTPGISRLSWCVFQCKELLRAYATFSHPNVLGGFLAVTLTLLVGQIGRKKWIVLPILLGIVALLLSFSRSAWLVAVIGLGCMYYTFVNKKIFFVVLLCLIIGIFIALFPKNTDESFVKRIELNWAAIEMWKRSPVFGVGLGNFILHLPDTDVSRQGNYLQPVHNIYLLLLSETGISGVIGVIWVIWVIRRKISLKVPFLMLLFLGFVDHYPVTLLQGQLLFTVLFALVLQ